MTSQQGPDGNIIEPDAPAGDGYAPDEGSGSVTTNEAELSDAGNRQPSHAAASTNNDGAPTVGGNAVMAEMDDLLADNDLLAAVTSLPPDVLSSVDHALDQLTTSIDLFDVPGLDFGDASQT